MDTEETRPRVVTSRRRVRYVRSAWRVHSFEVWSGSLVCRVTALRMEGSLLLWLGGGGAEPALGAVAVAVPGAASELHGEAGVAAALARRLAAARGEPVFVCCGVTLDRLTRPLLERALAAEMKSRPDCF